MALINGWDPSGPGLTNEEKKDLTQWNTKMTWVKFVENWDIHNARKVRENSKLSKEELSSWVESRIQLGLKYFYWHGDPDVVRDIEEETWIHFIK